MFDMLGMAAISAMQANAVPWTVLLGGTELQRKDIACK